MTSERPPGYPAELECSLTLRDGRVVTVRPVVPSDGPELKAAIETADVETIRNRFLGGAPPTDDETIRHLVELDYDRRLAVAAFDENGKGVAIARYEGSPGSDEAEVAVAVDAGWRHVWLGTQLLAVLVRAALQRGIRRFVAVYLPSNRDVRDLLEGAGLPEQKTYEGGIVEDVITLPGKAAS